MPRLRQSLPKLCTHRASNRAVVTLDGKDLYLGAAGSECARLQYDRIISEWLVNGRTLSRSATRSVSEIIARFWEHAQVYYRRSDGTQTSEVDNYRQALGPLRDLYGDQDVADFGPLKLRAVREAMIKKGWARTNINKQVSRIRSVFRWAVSQELVCISAYESLRTVQGLAAGRSEAHETEPVKPVDESTVHAVLPFLSRQLRAVVMLQLYTAARPSEILQMKPSDIKMFDLATGTYRPNQHKTAHHGHCRTIALGPKAIEVLRPFLAGREPNRFAFSPAEAEAERRAKQHAMRIAPISCGNRPRTNMRIKPSRQPRDHFDVDSYRRAIARACKLARVPHFHPHQLRHTAATSLRAQFGIEVAQAVCGHRHIKTTELYAEVNLAKVAKVVAQFG